MFSCFVQAEINECIICLENDSTMKYSCNTCKNEFHETCIKEMIKVSPTYDKCPYCRGKLPNILNEAIKERRTGGKNGITWWQFLGIESQLFDIEY